MESIRVRRANVILDVPSYDKDRYVNDGFSVIDIKTGNIIEEAISNDVNVLRNEVIKLKEENKSLATKIKSKDKKISELKEDIKKLSEE